jgi:transcriptional regulator of acetoin/glycerol metabolism
MPATLRSQKIAASDQGLPSTTSGGLNLRDTETSLILLALEDCRQNRSEAAKKLGISRRTLHRRLKELNLFKRSLHL